MQKLPKMHVNHNSAKKGFTCNSDGIHFFFHQIPSLTSLQTEHINSRTFGALLKPLGFLDLVGSGISLVPSCQSLCAEGGGGEVLAIPAIPAIPQKWGWWEGAGIRYTHTPFFVWNGWVGC